MDQRLHDAAREGDVAALQTLLRQDPQILHRVASSTFYEETPLHVASRAGKTGFVRELITRMPSFAIEKDRSKGLIPLHMASASGNVDIVTQLLTLDSSLQQCQFKDNSGRIPLHDAVIRGRVPVIEMLISHSPQSLEEVTERGETVLHLAAKNNHSQVLQVLIEKMKEHGFLGIIDAKDKDGGKTFWELGQTKENNELDKESELRNAILVVAGLIVTLAYTACVTPPPTIWKEGRKLDVRCIFKGSLDFKHPTNTCPARSFYFFMLFNTTAFMAAVAFITCQSTGKLTILRISIVPLVFNYWILLVTLCSDPLSLIILVLLPFFMLAIIVLMVVKVTVLAKNSWQELKVCGLYEFYHKYCRRVTFKN